MSTTFRLRGRRARKCRIRRAGSATPGLFARRHVARCAMPVWLFSAALRSRRGASDGADPWRGREVTQRLGARARHVRGRGAHRARNFVSGQCSGTRRPSSDARDWPAIESWARRGRAARTRAAADTHVSGLTLTIPPAAGRRPSPPGAGGSMPARPPSSSAGRCVPSRAGGVRGPAGAPAQRRGRGRRSTARAGATPRSRR